MKKLFLFVIGCLLSIPALFANNVQISNVSIINNGPGNIQVQFDVSWENSWRTNVGQNNYDGVWVFFKYKNASGLWTHMTMTGNNNVIPVGFDAYQTNDFLKVGAMLYRESTNMGAGTATLTGVRLGVISTLPYNIDVRGFAIEMVFVPAPTTRPFFGDGDGVTESQNAFHYTDNTATTSSVVPMRTDANIFDDVALDGPADGIYVYSNDTIQKSNPIGTLDPFPTMKALWCMKYEISQAGYRDFLNTLSYTQQDTRTEQPPNSTTGTRAMVPTGNGNARNNLMIKTSGVPSTTPAVYGCDASGNGIYDEAGDGEWVACNYLYWPDVAAYLDWSGLAPMSELQYERMCRGSTSAGPQPAMLTEYAWGTNTIFGALYTFSGGFTANEAPTNASASLGNAIYSATSNNVGVYRNGLFANANSTRITSGATLYGIMEMSGNVAEYCITLGNAAGRSVRFIPNGSGGISANGNAQLSVGGAGFWPGMEGNINTATANTCAGTCEVTGNAGIYQRGGHYFSSSSSLAIAFRQTITPSISSRSSSFGGRGVLYIR